MSAACPILGFAAEFQLRPHLDASILAAIQESFLTEVVAPRGLALRGVPPGERWSCVIRGEAGQATAADRDAVLAWAHARPEVVDAKVGQVIDLTDS